MLPPKSEKYGFDDYTLGAVIFVIAIVLLILIFYVLPTWLVFLAAFAVWALLWAGYFVVHYFIDPYGEHEYTMFDYLTPKGRKKIEEKKWNNTIKGRNE